MGRKKVGELVRSCFLVGEGLFVCKFCQTKLTSDHLGNFKSHLIRRHKEAFGRLQDEQVQQQQVQQSENADDPARKKIKIELELSENDVQDICAGFVTECGVALRFFNTNTFQKLFTPICRQLSLHKITRNNIGEILMQKHTTEVNNLKTTLKNRIISIKIDSAQRLFRNVVCLNAQYLLNGEITIKTLAVNNFREKHTARNLKELILKSLERYDITISQVYSITSDNGSNMVSCGNLLQHESKEVEMPLLNPSEDVDDAFFESFETIFEDLEFDTCVSQNFQSIVVIRCAAHTIQLSVNDVFKNEEIKNCFRECRNVVRKLRTPAMHRLISSQNLLPPTADCPTRWSYSYELLKRLRNLDTFISENMKEANINWSFVDEFLSSFSIIKKTTVKLQEKNLLFGDFIKTYLEMILVVKKEADKYHISKLLLQSLNQRKDNLLQNPTVAAAIYLDPRLRRLLHSPEFAPLKSVAVAHLKALYLKIHGNDNNTQEPAANSSSEVHEDSDNLLVTLLNQISQYEPRSENTTEAFSIIEAFNENCDLKANLADYWESKKFTHSTSYTKLFMQLPLRKLV
ncbi:uncharacterized protein LOC118741522 [Rhagoletis pomonella]|uniref:uncharacterized protein LOC118741522 n=1 Tax=Rhagoletis pomonella TaxID=28610 RepID=UPI00177AC819|nr:uncharacterized protein LOC118741522 [Rhagoletis pomonella]